MRITQQTRFFDETCDPMSGRSGVNGGKTSPKGRNSWSLVRHCPPLSGLSGFARLSAGGEGDEQVQRFLGLNFRVSGIREKSCPKRVQPGSIDSPCFGIFRQIRLISPFGGGGRGVRIRNVRPACEKRDPARGTASRLIHPEANRRVVSTRMLKRPEGRAPGAVQGCTRLQRAHPDTAPVWSSAFTRFRVESAAGRLNAELQTLRPSVAAAVSGCTRLQPAILSSVDTFKQEKLTYAPRILGKLEKLIVGRELNR